MPDQQHWSGEYQATVTNCKYQFQMQVFLSRLNGPHIGLTAFGLFPVNAEVVLIVSMNQQCSIILLSQIRMYHS